MQTIRSRGWGEGTFFADGQDGRCVLKLANRSSSVDDGRDGTEDSRPSAQVCVLVAESQGVPCIARDAEITHFNLLSRWIRMAERFHES